MAEKSEKKADVVLSDGREVVYDLTKLSVKEWRTLTNTENPMPLDDQDALLLKVAGLEGEDSAEIPFLDYRKLSDGFWKAATRPLDNPN